MGGPFLLNASFALTSHGFAAAEIDWAPGEPPRSRIYGDIYHSRDDGLAESRTVFLEGCGLPLAWTGRRHFSVGELGFGAGLNIVALLDLWRLHRPPNGHLHIFSVEAHLMTADDAARALSAWPEVAQTAALLLARWPRPIPGFQRLALDSIGATIDVAVMEVGEALTSWSGAADAWFLDGFSPALNPQMWRREVIRLVYARSADGARLASYTVASQIRRDLAEAGFEVQRKPGFGRKRMRLEATRPGHRTDELPPARVAIIGGGIAAASLSRAFANLGVDPRIVVGSSRKSASTGPAALVAPRLDAGRGAAAAFFTQAFQRAVDLYGNLPCSIIARGALQLATKTEDDHRFATLTANGMFDPARTRLTTQDESSALLGEAAGNGITFDEAVVVEPARVLDAWLGASTSGTVDSIHRSAGGWSLGLSDGDQIEADVVIIASGYASKALAPELDVGAVRGQASWTGGASPPLATLAGGYAIGTRHGVMFGATHDRGDIGVDERDEDHARNLSTLEGILPKLAERISGAPLAAHVGTRATTRDFMPLAGRLSEIPGLFVLSGLGSRGYCLAPLLAEHVAALALRVPSPLPVAAAALVDPERFSRRKARAPNRQRRKPRHEETN